MRHSLHSHIIYLENTIQHLRDRLTLPRLNADERAGIAMQLAMAERAVARYREAYALEISVAGSEPPAQPSGKSGAEQGDARNSRPDKKKGNQSAFQAPAGNRAARRRSAIAPVVPIPRQRASATRTRAA